MNASNRKKLNKLTSDMISEINNLTDLTKKELPVLVKEYIQYELISSYIGLLISIFVFIVSITFLVFGMSASNHDGIDYVLAGSFGTITSSVAILINLFSLLYLKLQPRRSAIKAIKAITSLFE